MPLAGFALRESPVTVRHVPGLPEFMKTVHFMGGGRQYVGNSFEAIGVIQRRVMRLHREDSHVGSPVDV